MADKSQMTDEELEQERLKEAEQEESPDVEKPEGEEPEEQGEEEPGAPAGKNSEEEDEEGSEGEPDDKPDKADQGPEEAEKSTFEEKSRQTRKERRAERAKRFSDLRRDFQKREAMRQQVMQRPNYDPLDYSKTEEELTVDQLEQDRNQYGDSKMTEGMQIERFYAEQERFNDRLESDNDYILSKPDYAFMDETSDDFDADLANDVNDLYLTVAGYDDSNKTYSNTNVRYKQFVPMMKQMMDKYAAKRNTDSERNISRQRSKAGVRPSAGSGRGSRTFTPEQIANMTPAQYERYKADIDRQINSLLPK